jgi:hypothetical protein
MPGRVDTGSGMLAESGGRVEGLGGNTVRMGLDGGPAGVRPIESTAFAARL